MVGSALAPDRNGMSSLVAGSPLAPDHNGMSSLVVGSALAPDPCDIRTFNNV
jgi:hypothetical protein